MSIAIRVMLLSAAVLLPHAGAADPPRYDVELHCDQIAGFTGSYSSEMFNFCVESEQRAYDGLKAHWDALPDRVRGHCNEIAAFVPPGSYEMLAFCVDQERAAAGDRSTLDY